MYTRFWWGNTIERDHFAVIGVVWRINIKMVPEKVGGLD
jgi:hypothetical protein